MKCLSFVSYLALLVCSLLFAYELIFIMIKAIKKESFQAANDRKADQLLPPIITLCPGDAWKSSGNNNDYLCPEHLFE